MLDGTAIKDCAMSESKGSSDESIGRPKEWREGRYQRPGASVDLSVVKPAQTPDESPDRVSTPVTKKDYEDQPPRTK
jgi:hypothetical protein